MNYGFKRKPNLNYFKVWGCRAIVRLPEPKIKKLGQKAIECIFIGYADHSKGYRFLVMEPNDYVSVNTVIDSRDAEFYENKFSSLSRNNNEKVEVLSRSNNSTSSNTSRPRNESDEQPEIRRSKRRRIEKSFGPDFVVYLVEGTRDKHKR